jgi:hypothetical protein
MMRWAEHKYTIKTFLVRKSEGKRPHGRARHRWENIIMGLKSWGGRVWTGSSWLKICSNGGVL